MTLLDTGIVIRHLRRIPGYAELLIGLSEDDELAVASITRLEVIAGTRDHEQVPTMALLDALRMLPLEAETADRAGKLIRNCRARGQTLAGPDAVIAATALVASARLISTNPQRFPIPELDVWVPDQTTAKLIPRGTP